MALTELTYKDGTGVSRTAAVHTDDDGNYLNTMSLDGSVQTFSAGANNVVLRATPKEILVIFGNVASTVRVLDVWIQGAATAAGSMFANLYKCSSAGTLGSAVLTALTAAPHDSQNSVTATAVSTVGTADYGTPPTSVGVLWAGRVPFDALTTDATSAGTGSGVHVSFASHGEQGIVLRGTSEGIVLTFGADAVPSGGVLDVAIRWTQEVEA